MSAADGRGEGGASGDDSGARTVVHGLVAIALTVLAVVASVFGSVPGVLLGQNTAAGFAVALLGSELGFAVAGIGFLLVTGRGLGYLDLDGPAGVAGWGLVAVFTVGAFVARSGILLATLRLGVEPAPSSIAEVDLPLRVLVAVLLPAMLLVVGPAEELLFRGVVQKFLREEASPRAAILGAGLLFGAVHVFSLVQSSGLGTLVSLVIITLVGFGLGWLYERTGSLPAAMVAHGGYNALIVGSAYALELVG